MTSGSGKSTLRFKRALVNSGKTVLTLTGKNAMLWAFGSSSSLGNHGGNRGSFSINFVTGAVTDMSSGADARAVARLAHGILALLGADVSPRGLFELFCCLLYDSRVVIVSFLVLRVP